MLIHQFAVQVVEFTPTAGVKSITEILLFHAVDLNIKFQTGRIILLSSMS